jgi:hypothetical protein
MCVCARTGLQALPLVAAIAEDGLDVAVGRRGSRLGGRSVWLTINVAGDRVAGDRRGCGSTGWRVGVKWGVLTLAGSSGRVDRERVRLFTELGADADSIACFGGPGQNPGPWENPIELFQDRVAALRRRCDRILVAGTSFGAEAALLVGAHTPEVDAVAAFAPSDVVWAGVRPDGSQTSHWTLGGEPLPFVPLVNDWHPSTDPPAYRDLYEISRRTAVRAASEGGPAARDEVGDGPAAGDGVGDGPAVGDGVGEGPVARDGVGDGPVARDGVGEGPVARDGVGGGPVAWDPVEAARIPAERIPTLILVAGGDDQVWPSVEQARAIAARRRLPTTVLVDPAAGHRVLLPGERPPTTGIRMARGGTPAADRRLGAAAWTHLRRLLTPGP